MVLLYADLHHGRNKLMEFVTLLLYCMLVLASTAFIPAVMFGLFYMFVEFCKESPLTLATTERIYKSVSSFLRKFDPMAIVVVIVALFQIFSFIREESKRWKYPYLALNPL
jgi:hypothetical protein